MPAVCSQASRRISYPDSHSLSHNQKREDKSTIVQAPQTRTELICTFATGRLQRNMQVIVQAECPIAIRAFPGSRQSPFLNTLVAKDVPASLDHRVLEVLLADGTYCHDLVKVSIVRKQEMRHMN